MKIEDELKQQEFTSAYHKAYLNLLFTYHFLNSRLNAVFDNFNITSQQYNVLRILRGSYPKLLSATEIKAVMLDKSPDLTRLIDRLTAKGYVTREVCPANRRKIEIGISREGIQIVNRAEPQLNEVMMVMENLSAEEADNLSRLLELIRA